MKKMNNETIYYNQESLWGDAAEYQINVMNDIQYILPQDVKKILDVGCGDGFVINRLAEKGYDCTGMDISETPLKYVKCAKTIGSADDIPFPDNSFDLVMINDVLEHLNGPVLAKTLTELARVSRKYVLITVPFMENLRAGFTMCRECGTAYHISHHINAFGTKELLHLFDNSVFVPSETVYSGNRHLLLDLIQYEFRGTLRHYTEWEKSTCPVCGKNASWNPNLPSDTEEYRGICDMPETWTSQYPDRNECICLYSCKENTPRNTQGISLRRNGERCRGSLETGNFGKLIFRSECSLMQTDYCQLDLISADGVRHTLPRPDFLDTCSVFVPVWFHPNNLTSFSPLSPPDDLILKTLLHRLALSENAVKQMSEKQAALEQSHYAESEKLTPLEQSRRADAEKLATLEQAQRADAEKLATLEQAQRADAEKLATLEQAQRTDAEKLNQCMRRGMISLVWQDIKKIIRGGLTFSEKCRKYKEKIINGESWSDVQTKTLDLAEPLLSTAHAANGKRHFLTLCHDQEIDRRIVQQVESLCRNGWSGIIVALSMDASDHLEQRDGYQIHRVGLSHIVPNCKCYWIYQRLLFWSRKYSFGLTMQRLFYGVDLLFYHIMLKVYYRCATISCPLPFDPAFVAAGKKYRADLIFAEDLTMLKAGAILQREWGCPLIFDSHEFYPEQRVFSSTQKRLMHAETREFIGNCSAVITVSDGIAELFQQYYGIEKPYILHNVTNAENVRNTHKFHHLLNLAKEEKVVLYQGGLTPDRNIENLLKGFCRLNPPETHLVFLGPVAPNFLAHLKKIAGTLLDRKVHFLKAVPREELLGYTASADFGVIPYKVIDLNTKFCMPNKFFEFIQAGLPILANNLIEVKKILDSIGGGGICADLNSPENAASALRTMLTRDLAHDHEVLLSAREKLSWDFEANLFQQIVDGVIQK